MEGQLQHSPEAAIADRLRWQATACERLGSPLYAGLLGYAAADVEAGGPTWDLLRGHEHDPGPSALALRLMGGVNRLVLGGDEPALADAYRHGSTGIPAAWREFRAVLIRNLEALRRLVELPVQTNEVGRCAALLPGFLAVANETGLPLRLLEVGASAGLNLRWDRYRYQARQFEWGPAKSPVRIDFQLEGVGSPRAPAVVEIAERRGCDPAPIDPSTPGGRLALLAYVWPDQSARVERLRTALDLAARLGVSVAREGAASWAERNLAAPSPGQATVLFHSIVEQYVENDELEAFHRRVRDAAKRATEDTPLAWLRMEPAGGLADVRLVIWPGGRDRHLARVGYHGTPVTLLR